MLDKKEILEIVGAEIEDASTILNSHLEGNREDALDYYLGNNPVAPGNGRSGVVSTDVADAIEWILPQILESLTSHGSPVAFDPISPQDEMQSDLETDFTHHVFMSENEGFLNLHTAVKDSLLMKNGIFKIWYDDTPDEDEEAYDGLTFDQVMGLTQDPEFELLTYQGILETPEGTMVEELDGDSFLQQVMEAQQAMQQFQMQMQQFQQQMQQLQQAAQQDPQAAQQLQMMQQQQPQPPQIPLMQMVAAVTGVRITSKGCIKVDVVPPEEFLISSAHNSSDLQDVRFVGHKVMKTRSDLLEEGYDPDVIMNARKATVDDDMEERFQAQGETILSKFIGKDESQELVEVVECFMKIDMNQDGIAELMKITVLGDGDDVYEVLDAEPIEEIPFVGFSTINMPHKFWGLSIYDRLKELQDSKTSLWRNILDNVYLQNNREKEVVEGQVNIDDLLISRPGGIKRVKAPGMIRELQVQPIGADGFNMLNYMDQVRTGRVGVSPESQGQDMAVSNDTAHGIERLMTAKEKLTGLMIRLVAETALKPAYRLIRDLLVRHQDTQTSFLFRDQWVNVNPSTWGKRSKVSVKVGTGTGDDMRKQAALTQVMQMQAQIYAQPGQALVGAGEMYKAIDDWCDASGINGALGYFTDPNSPEGQQKAQEAAQQAQQQSEEQKQVEQAIAQAQQQLAQAEMMKGQASLEKNKMQMQSDIMKANYESKIKELERMLEEAKTSAELQYKYTELNTKEALELTKMELEANKEATGQYLSNKKLEIEKERNNAARSIGSGNTGSGKGKEGKAKPA